MPTSPILAVICAPWAAFSSSVFSGSSHFGLPASSRSSSCAAQMRLISSCAISSASSSRSSGTWFGAGLDHRETFLRADDDQVEVVAALHRGERRVDDELPVDLGDAHGADRAGERHRAQHERGRGPVDAEDVVPGDEIGRQHGADDLHLVAVALRPERPDRAVDHPRGQDRPLGGASLALEEAAGDLPGRVHPLLDIHREREKVGAFAGLGSARRGRQDHGVATADDDRSVRLLGETSGLHRDFRVADRDGDTRVQRRIHFHLLSPRDGGGGLGQRPRALSQTSTASPGLGPALSPQTEFLDQRPVTLQISLLKIVQQTPPLAYELQEPASRVMVLAVSSEVLGELLDTSSQKSDLNLCRAGVRGRAAVRAHQLLLCFLRQSHCGKASTRTAGFLLGTARGILPA